jgi:DNA-binding SARP family transcriptional activator/tetratricopeptide (TPR) repeat protein
MSVVGAVTGSSVSARLFGPPRIERDGETVGVDTRKAIALLAYLAVTGRPHSRDHLAALLWPDADQSRARSALRRTLSTLNSALGGRGLRIERESLALAPDEIDLDVLSFRSLVAAGDPGSLRRAAALAAGEFLSGFVVRDSAEFDDWQLQAADELKREVGDVLERLVSGALETDPDAALTYAQTWVDLDELHEPAHRALMRAYARKGDRSSALKQYRTCVAALERGLGVEPLEDTSELYESIRENRDDVVASQVPRTPLRSGRAVQALPLVGRDAEIDELQRAFTSSATDGRLIVIGGEPGIGKTRLAGELVERVRSLAGLVVEATCHPEEHLMAFGTIVEILRGIPRERLDAAPYDALVETSRVLPDLGRELVPGALGAEPPVVRDSPAARRRLVESVATVITHATSGVVPTVIVVDDAQWIDASSLEILRFVVRRLRGWSLCLVMTWRTEEVPPAHALRRMLADAERVGLATGIILQRLTEQDVDELVRLTGTDDGIAATLFAETAGVPFFLSEYIKSGERLPSGVRDLLASRVANVSAAASQVLTAAAVIGRAFDPRTVREASGRSEDEVVGALDELVASGLLAETGDAYDVTHPKLREFVYEDASLGRRRLLHARIAKALVRASRRRPELHALVAQHFERAGDEDAAAEHFRVAGAHARGVYANAEALAHLRSALALGPPDAALHEAIGDLLTLDGRYGEAIAAFEKAAALGGDLAVVGRKLGDVRQRLGDWDSAEAHYLEAEQALDPGPQRVRVLAERALNAHRAGRADLARELASRASADARAADDARALAQAHNVEGILASHGGDGAAARRHLQASLDYAEATGDPGAEAAALNNLALALRMEGATDIALSNAYASLEICTRIGDRHREAAVHSNIADILHDLGRPDEAIEHVKVSAAILMDVGEPDEPQPEIWKLVEW